RPTDAAAGRRPMRRRTRVRAGARGPCCDEARRHGGHVHRDGVQLPVPQRDLQVRRLRRAGADQPTLVTASLDDVARIALARPEVTEDDRRGSRTWAVAGTTFAWERAYSKADLRRFGDEEPPREPIVAVRVDDLIEKEAVLAAGTDGVFTIPHFDGYAAVLI